MYLEALSRPPDPRMYIGGRWLGAQSGAVHPSINPFTREAWISVPEAGPEDVDLAVRAADSALRGDWGATSGFQRADLMRRLAAVIAENADSLARIEAADNGKLLRECRAQVESLPNWLHYFAGLADKIHGDTIPTLKPNFFVYTRHEPVGVVAAIVPWNSPLQLLMWKLAPALAAGCTLVAKPSDHTPTSALAFAECVEKAGIPAGVFNVITSTRVETAQSLVEHPLVSKVAFTGSTEVGIKVAQAAAKNLSRVSLELGGKSAQIAFADASTESVVNGIIAGVFAASGQTCIAGSRLIIEETVADEVVERLVQRCQTIRLGDPLEEATEMGPLSSETHHARVAGFIERAASSGATIACGGRTADHVGYFIKPTVVLGAERDSEILREEVFGPVITVQTFSHEEEAIELANDSPYALAAGLWTNSVHRVHRLVPRIRAGTIWVNSYRLVAPNVPFGGMGLSGWGRENGIDAVGEYLETKAVWIETEGETRDPFVVG